MRQQQAGFLGVIGGGAVYEYGHWDVGRGL